MEIRASGAPGEDRDHAGRTSKGRQTTRDAAHQLARFLFHATKTGTPPQDIKDQLLALEVSAQHPHAAPTKLRRPFESHVSVVHVDTSRLPCDHGISPRAHPAELLGALRRIVHMAETGEPGIAAVARAAISRSVGVAS